MTTLTASSEFELRRVFEHHECVGFSDSIIFMLRNLLVKYLAVLLGSVEGGVGFNLSLLL